MLMSTWSNSQSERNTVQLREEGTRNTSYRRLWLWSSSSLDISVGLEIPDRLSRLLSEWSTIEVHQMAWWRHRLVQTGRGVDEISWHSIETCGERWVDIWSIPMLRKTVMIMVYLLCFGLSVLLFRDLYTLCSNRVVMYVALTLKS